MRQAITALDAAGSQDTATIFGSHALQKAMFFRTLALFWLKSSIGHKLYVSLFGVFTC
jgi:hypothetical protein